MEKDWSFVTSALPFERSKVAASPQPGEFDLTDTDPLRCQRQSVALASVLKEVLVDAAKSREPGNLPRDHVFVIPRLGLSDEFGELFATGYTSC